MKMKKIDTIADWLETDDVMCIDTVNAKYLFSKEILGNRQETIQEFLTRVSMGKHEYFDLISNLFFIPGGRILANKDLYKYGIKCTYSNCYVLAGPKDNIESIYDTAKHMARTFSYGGGVGIDISRLAPKNARVRNTAERSTGAVSFCETYSEVSNTIGMKARRGALMICIRDDHPDLEEFITHKSNLNLTTGANMSVKMSDKFFQTLKDGPKSDGDPNTWRLHFRRAATGETIEKWVNPDEIMNLIAKTAWEFSEPGILYWDTINRYCLLGEDPSFEYEATNPCGELPLPNGGACLLGAMNLSKYFDDSNTAIGSIGTSMIGIDTVGISSNGITIYTKYREYKNKTMTIFMTKDIVRQFEKDIHTSVRYLDEVLTENAELHPLAVQKTAVQNYRPIGLGIMGLADVFIQCGVKYGSEESKELSDVIGYLMAFNAIEESCNLAKEFGAFKKCKPEYIVESEFYKYNVLNNPYIEENRIEDLHNNILKYGLRNSQVLTIAPTGTTSTILNVSGGIEPVFSNHYTRTTKTISKDGDKDYDVYPKAVWKYANNHPTIFKEDGTIDTTKLPDYFITAPDINYKDRIEVQAIWQTHIDNSISSTVNLPEDITIEEVKDLYIYAHEKGLKGITVHREGNKRESILHDKSKEKKNDKENKETNDLKYQLLFAIESKYLDIKRCENIKWSDSVPVCMDANSEIYVKAVFELDNGKIETEPMNWYDYKLLDPKARLKFAPKEVNNDRKVTNISDNKMDELTILPKENINHNISHNYDENMKKNKLITRKDLGKRLEASVHYINIACGHIYVVISRDENGRPVEVFMQSSKSGGCSANTECLGRFASACLRHGMDIDDVVDITKGVKCPACTNLKGKGIELDGLSCGDAMARVIKEEYEIYRNNKTKPNRSSISEISSINSKSYKNDSTTVLKGNTIASVLSIDQDSKNMVVELNNGEKKNVQYEPIKWNYEEHSAQENIDRMICPECGKPLRFTEGCIKCLNCTFSKC